MNIKTEGRNRSQNKRFILNSLVMKIHQRSQIAAHKNPLILSFIKIKIKTIKP
jgi:hypothetical protein